MRAQGKCLSRSGIAMVIFFMVNQVRQRVSTDGRGIKLTHASLIKP